MATILMNKESTKTSEPHKLILNSSQRLDLRGSNKHVALQNVSIYYMWGNIREQYRNISIQDYIEYIIKKQETLTTIPPIHVYINRK